MTSMYSARVARDPETIVEPHPWQHVYGRVLTASDAACVLIAVFGAQAAWLGPEAHEVAGVAAIDYTLLSSALATLWLLSLALFGTRSPQRVGYGATEYQSVAGATLGVFGMIALISYLLSAEISRGYILIALPVGLSALILTRIAWRAWLGRLRTRGRMVSRVAVIGSGASCTRIQAELDRQPQAGLRVVVRRVSEGATDQVAELGTLLSAISEYSCDTVIVAADSGLSVEMLRRLSWSLERGRRNLIIAPSLVDVSGPRIHARPVAGLPLLHVETPHYSGLDWLLKRSFDLVAALLLAVVLSPLLLVVAALIKLTSPGPVLYVQERIGADSKPFRMLKFRSMHTGADADLEKLLLERGTIDQPLFKVQDDPRVTPIGRVLRKYSIDELPQLINVMRGEMSLVGPRPQREGEVALYDAAAMRRLIVKPGMSGLWQVSGRSQLSWNDTVRLDLYYVENWSFIGDLGILLRTFKAVMVPGSSAH